MKIIDAHKGCYEYTNHFYGLAGHGSQPDKGVNAVENASKFIQKLLEIREHIKNNPPKNSIFICGLLAVLDRYIPEKNYNNRFIDINIDYNEITYI